MTQAKGVSGWRLYARIARLLLDTPSTYAEVVTALGIHIVACRLILRRMHTMEMLHICDWQRSPTRNLLVPVWKFGKGEDAPKPPGAKGNNGATLQPNSELIAFRVMLRELTLDHLTSAQLADYSGTHAKWTDRLVKYMHELKMVRIADWQRPMHSGSPVPMFAFAPHGGQDMPRPLRMSRKVIDRRNWAKRKAKQQQQRLLRAIAPNASIFTLVA